MWRFTLLWTLILYAIFHLGATAVAIVMKIGTPRSKDGWKFGLLVPLPYALLAGLEAMIAGSVVGVMSVALNLCGRVSC